MSFEAYIAIGAGVLFGIIVLGLVVWKFPRRVKHEKFADKWQKVQKRCADSTEWALAVVEADDLLNEALKKKRFKGRNMGERMVKAQKIFTNNDAVWFGHKLRTKLDLNPDMHLSKDDVLKALSGLRQGLKDIGALK